MAMTSTKSKVCLFLSLTVVVSVLVSCITLTVLVISSLHLHHLQHSLRLYSPLLSDVPVPSGYPVLLGGNGYDPSAVKSVDISTDAKKVNPLSQVSVSFYTGACKFHYESVFLSNVSRDLKATYDNRLAFNYNYGDKPLYVAGGDSILKYFSSASSDGPVGSNECPMELFLFDDQSKYQNFQQDSLLPKAGFINRSGCLPVGSKLDEVKNSTIVFHLPKPGSYFVSISIKKGVWTRTNISGYAQEFSTTEFKPVKDCVLNENFNRCTISLHNHESWFHPVSSENLCIWARSQYNVNVNVTTASDNCGKLMNIGLNVFSGVFIVLLFVVIISCFLLMIMRYCISREKSIANGEGKPLIEKHTVK